MEHHTHGIGIPEPVRAQPNGHGSHPTPTRWLGPTPINLSSGSSSSAQHHPLADQHQQAQLQQQLQSFRARQREEIEQATLAGQHQQTQLQQQLQGFWARQREEIEQATDFKNHSLPLARIKKIMKSDEDLRMISSEAPVILVRDVHTRTDLEGLEPHGGEQEEDSSEERCSPSAAITRTDIFDFLVDMVPRDDLKDDLLAKVTGAAGGGGLLPPPGEGCLIIT